MGYNHDQNKNRTKKLDVLKKLLLISTYFVFVLNITNVEREIQSVSYIKILQLKRCYF